MTLSLWRYSHLVLALVASAFLLVASVTGIILAFEPISHQTQGYAKISLETVSLATAIAELRENYDEVFTLEVEPSGFVKASVLTEDFETKDLYIDPRTGQSLGEVPARPEIFSFTTNLHRSLFLKSTGRFFVGLVSLLLVLIAVTGMLLLAKRQGGFRKIFSKVQKEYFEMRYHVILSRWFFVPIIILAVTGVYLSAEKFGLLPSTQLRFEENATAPSQDNFEIPAEIPLFRKTMLSEVRKVDFPFSDDPEDYFRVALKEREIQVNQLTGAVVATADYPFTLLASRLSFKLHTGAGSIWWSVVLLLASASIVFFIYSGFVMTLKRKRSIATPAMPDKDDSEIVILIGSETGNTFDLGRRLFNALTEAGKVVFMDELNNYTTYARARQLIILTATYGEGEAPTNARKFKALFKTVAQPNPVAYSVVGFGSLEYPDYCQFAVEVDAILQNGARGGAVLPLYKINDADFTDFKKWAQKWSERTKIPFKLVPPKRKRKLKMQPFKVLDRTELNIDDTFLLRLRPKRNAKFTSGDLLSVLPPGAETVRQYSIAKKGRDIILSVKKHEFGKASNYLFQLAKGQKFKAAIERNPHFYFPKKSCPVVLIANGTGIAPFLGMVSQNREVPIHLLWGGRFLDSFALYEKYLFGEDTQHASVHLVKCHSREGERQYVQDLVVAQAQTIKAALSQGGTLMLCGSLTMQHGVLEVLEKILADQKSNSLDQLLQKGQLRMDCY